LNIKEENQTSIIVYHNMFVFHVWFVRIKGVEHAPSINFDEALDTKLQICWCNDILRALRSEYRVNASGVVFKPLDFYSFLPDSPVKCYERMALIMADFSPHNEKAYRLVRRLQEHARKLITCVGDGYGRSQV